MAKIFPIDFEEKLTMAQDDYILFSDSEDGNKIKKAQYSNLKWEKWDTWPQWPQGIQGIQWPQWEQGIQWPQGEQGIQWETWPQGEEWPEWPTWPTGNWIASITSSKVGKTTTVTITETNGDVDSFQIQDWADGQWAWDVTWPESAVDGHLAVFDGSTGKIIKDWWAIPTTTVVDSLDSTSATSALSANQGKVLNDKIEDLSWLWKFLSLWDATTGQPISFPLDTPYSYTTWDYFLVETVSTATPPVNYKPNGSSYTGTASSTTESEELAVWDIYIYDGTNWLLQLNHGKSVSFSEIAGSPDDNTALDNALSAKQDTLTAGTGINIDGNNEITNTWVTSVNGNTWAVTVEEGDSKVFEITDLTSAASLATATQAYTYAYTNGKSAIIKYSSGYYVYSNGVSSAGYFTRTAWNWAISSWTWAAFSMLKVTISSWSATAISVINNNIKIASTAPASWTNDTITLVI